MQRRTKQAVVAGLVTFLLGPFWVLPAPASAGQAGHLRAIKKYVVLGSARKIVKLGSVRFLQVR